MKRKEELRRELNKIDHKSYGMYKNLKGSYLYDDYILHIDHVQGDPFASPSRIRIEIKQQIHRFPEIYYSQKANPNLEKGNVYQRKITLEDQVLRKFRKELKRVDRRTYGSGKSGNITTCQTGQKVLERIALVFYEDKMELRFEMGFPARGRTILAEEMEKLLFYVIPSLSEKTLIYKNWSQKEQNALKDSIFLCDDQYAIRQELVKNRLAAFIADGSILPRESGISDLPMPDAIPFISCDSMRMELDLPHRGKISGMAIPQGITIIVGGGYHGKSTLLRALEQGIYDHIAGDGREYVITQESAMKIRAEDGRGINHTDISMFIKNLPAGQDTADFYTENASGSTSQAANLMEALESGSELLLIDEDTSATNFMIRDMVMSQLVSDDQEPITPLLRRIRSLNEKYGISFIIVVGSSGDYLGVSDHVIQMDNYRVRDVTDKAKKIAEKYYSDKIKGKRLETNLSSKERILFPKKTADRIKMKTIVKDTIMIDREVIDIRYLEQLCDSGQAVSLGYMLSWILKNIKKPISINRLVDYIYDQIDECGLIKLTEGHYPGGHPVRPRRQELYGCINRYRSMHIE